MPRENLSNEGSIRIALNEETQRFAKEVGTARFYRHLRERKKHKWNRPEGDMTIEKTIDYIGSEIAASEIVGWNWIDTKDPDHEGDIGPGRQVRHTTYLTGKLILHPEDEDDHQFFLMVGTMPVYELKGWILGAEGKKQEFWNELVEGRPCYAVPQKNLRPYKGQGGIACADPKHIGNPAIIYHDLYMEPPDFKLRCRLCHQLKELSTKT